MGRYLIVRILLTLPVLIGVASVVFVVIRLTGDPVDVMLGPDSPVEARQALRHQMGLDAPLPVQYVLWLRDVVQGNLGRSIATGEDVSAAVGRRMGPTLLLALTSTAIAATAGLTLGTLAGWRRGSTLDHLTLALATLGTAVPTFWIGLLLIAVLSIGLHWLPDSGMFSPRAPEWREVPAHLVMPAITLALPSIAVITRLTRTAIIENLQQDYVRTARAKGLHARQILVGHALRNSLIPVVTMLGLQFGNLLGGAIIVEATFSWPGMGSLMLRAIFARDFPMVQGTVLYVALAFVLVTLATDMVYGYLNPRIRFS